MILTIKLRLKDKHAAELNRQAKAVNRVWNFCNETQQKAVAYKRRWLNYHDFRRLTTGVGKLLDLHSHTVQQVCMQYDRSRSQHKKAFLKWRGRKSLGWVPFNQGKSGVTLRVGKIRFRKCGYEAMHWRELPANALIRAGSFNQDARGRWYVNLRIEFAIEAFAQSGPTAVGIDLGLKTLASLSNGEKIGNPRFLDRGALKYACAQRANRKKQARNIAVKIGNRRKDYLHKLSTRIALTHGAIFVGNISSSAKARTKLARSVLDAGWSTLRRQLEYKAIRHGSIYREVDEYMTTQLCSDCGAVGGPKGIAQTGIREWSCSDCGATHDRDVNSAKNILARGLASLAEGAAQMRSSQYNCVNCSGRYEIDRAKLFKAVLGP